MLLIYFTYVFVFLVGFYFPDSAKHSNIQRIRSIINLVTAWCSKKLTSNSEASRIRQAGETLKDVKVELLDRYANALRFLHSTLEDTYIDTRYEVERNYPIGTWQRTAMDDFTGVLVAKDKIFPCIYGTKGFKANELDFVFLPSEDLNDIDVAKIGAKAILEYHKILSSRGRNISLVLMCPPPTSEKSVDQYHASFWSFLKRLRQLDPQPWPTKIPHDTSHQKWCMTFDNTEAFFAVLTPAHKQRLSRSAANFAMVYQPRYIFDVIFKDARYRESATKMVRELVDKFDQIPHSPDISDYGLNGTTESRQYFLLDENSPSASPYEDLDVAARDGYI